MASVPADGLTSVSNAVIWVKTVSRLMVSLALQPLCTHHLTSEQIKVILAFETHPLPIFSLTLFKEKKK